MTLNLGQGDLLIFAGGQIWHSVNKVTGSTSRITLGGLLVFQTILRKFVFGLSQLKLQE